MTKRPQQLRLGLKVHQSATPTDQLEKEKPEHSDEAEKRNDDEKGQTA